MSPSSPRHAGPDGRRTDQPRRARLRHLLAPAQGQHHLHRHADRRHGRQPGHRPDAVPGSRRPRQGHPAVHQQPGRRRSRPGWRSTTRCSSSSPTCRRSASARPRRWRAVLLAAGAKGKRFALPNSRILIHQPLMSGWQGQATDIDIAGQGDPADARAPQRDPRPPHAASRSSVSRTTPSATTSCRPTRARNTVSSIDVIRKREL